MKYEIGQRITGVVNNITDLGIFVTLSEHRHGLIFHGDFANQWPRQRSRFEIGQEVRVVITNIHKGKIGLSYMQVNNPEIIDPTNQFSEVDPKDLMKKLEQVLITNESELQKLKDDQ